MRMNDEIIYAVNSSDQVVRVNDAWDRFALDNCGERILKQEVIGRPLWDFVADDTVRELYRRALERTRAGHTIVFGFRCDGPECSRVLEMKIASAADGVVEFRSTCLSEHAVLPPSLEESSGDSGAPMLRVCSWCSKVETIDGWVPMEDHVARARHLQSRGVPTIAHGICPLCLMRATEELDG